MKIPKKITPDNLKDTIVEIRFNLNIQQELILGIVSQALPEGFKYNPLHNPIQRKIPIDAQNPNQNILLEFSGAGLFSDNEIKIQIRGLTVKECSIIFNSFNDYIGWDKYFPAIKNVMNSLDEYGIFHSFNRIGIRYISEFDNIAIFDKINGDFRLKMPNSELFNTTFRTEYMEDEKRIIMNLSNNIQKKDTKDKFSLVDIDVLDNLKSLTDLNELYKKIDDAHSLQKETFFKLITSDFLESLNPEY